MLKKKFYRIGVERFQSFFFLLQSFEKGVVRMNNNYECCEKTEHSMLLITHSTCVPRTSSTRLLF